MTNSQPVKLSVPARTITLAHGAGGRAMQGLIDELFVARFDSPELRTMEDQARIDLASLAAQGDRLAFTTDSFVVDPLFFPGGDIGKLAVCGTVNDLAVGGARPLYLTCSMIIEEGLELAVLERVVDSLAETARQAGVRIVTGDTKVVPRGAADKLFINTAGVGVIVEGVAPAVNGARAGDRILVSGPLGDHGAAITVARDDLGLQTDVASDCQPLHELVAAMIEACPQISSMRDITRGGLATVLNEIAAASAVSISLAEDAIPLRDEVRGICELLGLDPLYMACEGRLAAVVPAAHVDAVLKAMRATSAGAGAVVIGEVSAASPGRVSLQTGFGGERVIDTLLGEQLPRIC